MRFHQFNLYWFKETLICSLPSPSLSSQSNLILLHSNPTISQGMNCWISEAKEPTTFRCYCLRASLEFLQSPQSTKPTEMLTEVISDKVEGQEHDDSRENQPEQRGRQCQRPRRSVCGFLLLRGPVGDAATEPLPLAVSPSLASFFDSSPSKHHRSWSTYRGLWVSSSSSLAPPWLCRRAQGGRARGLCSAGWPRGTLAPAGVSFCGGEPISYLASFQLLFDMAA